MSGTKKLIWSTFVCAAFQAACVSGQEADAFGGGTRHELMGPCISLGERMQIGRDVRNYLAEHPEMDAPPPPAGAQKYGFYPQAGKFWGDLFPNNFVDLDNTSGIGDYNGTQYTYNGHHGIDTDLCTFSEQSIGVPVFAVLDGTVTAAHDGEFDQQTTQISGALANYVVLSHGGTHDTWYYHLKKNSVAVSVGQVVKAGQQLGLTASSGFSTGPHLHFESRYGGTYFEAFTGPSNPGTSGWVNQPTFRSEMYVRDFNITTDDLSAWAGPPTDTTRTGTFGTGSRLHRFWFIAQSFPASSTYRIRYLRPNGTVRSDGGTQNFNNSSFYKWSYWWFSRTINFDVTGTWMLELSLNGQVVVQAPITIVSGGVDTNRPPLDVTATFDPPLSIDSDVVFCRVPHRVIDDPDYDVVSYRYLWKRNGVTVRDVTNASLADAIPRNTCTAADVLTCTVTPNDGTANGNPVTINIEVRMSLAQWAQAHGASSANITDDSDRDGIPLLVEHVAHTSPTQPNVLPAPIRLPDGSMQWTLDVNTLADPQASFLVETSTNLSNWQPATPNATKTVWTAGSSADKQRFVRIVATLQ